MGGRALTALCQGPGPLADVASSVLRDQGAAAQLPRETARKRPSGVSRTVFQGTLCWPVEASRERQPGGAALCGMPGRATGFFTEALLRASNVLV